MPASSNNSRIHMPPVLLAVLLGIACLVPFLDKAFHIDDPLFLWVAERIQTHPFDFYGFPVTWYYTEQPMSEVTKNPPLASYYIALVASLFGWREWVLHLAFLLPAAAAIWGTYRLAERLCSRPLLATLAAVLTPVFLVSSTNVMCDTLMLAFWVWAIVFWDEGLRQKKLLSLFTSGILIGLCALTKYFGISLILLLGVYALARGRCLSRRSKTLESSGPAQESRPTAIQGSRLTATCSLRLWPLALVPPLAILIGYQAWTHALYGRGLLLDAASYAVATRTSENLVTKICQGLTFTGGCVASTAFFSYFLWSRRQFWAGVGLAGVLPLALPFTRFIFAKPLLYEQCGLNGPIDIQFCIFLLAGVQLLGLASADLWNRRDESAWLLFLWVMGTFVFAALVNWTINGRSILPLVPAAGILLVRRLEHRGIVSEGSSPWRVAWPLLPAALLALLVAWADYRHANSARAVAAEIQGRYGDRPGTVWFRGHWGFHYYMQRWGARIQDSNRLETQKGDIVVVPWNNCNFIGSNMLPPPDPVTDEIRHIPCPWLSVTNPANGAGFYAHMLGPLPFAFGMVPPDTYQIYEVNVSPKGGKK